MFKIRWKRVLILSAILSIIMITAIYRINYISKLSNENFLGKTKGEVEKKLGEPQLKQNEKVGIIYGYLIDKENSEFFVFDEDNKCVAHAQNLSRRYGVAKFDELKKELGEPVGKEANDLIFSDGTIYTLDKENVRISRTTKEYEEVLDEFEKKGIKGN